MEAANGRSHGAAGAPAGQGRQALRAGAGSIACARRRAASFVTRWLRQLQTESNAIVDWQTTLGKSLTRSEQPRAPLTHPNVLVADAAWLENGGLRSALAQAAQGLPLLILGGSAGDAGLWQRELALKLLPQSATTEWEEMRHLLMSGTVLDVAPGAQLPEAGGGWQAIARDKDGKPWLWQREWQKGRILWLGVRDWHRHAISEPAALGQWWQQVMDVAALGSEQKVRWLDADPMPLASLRTEICAQGVEAGGLLTVARETMRWLPRKERADAACAALWPRAAGWLPVSSRGSDSAIYVFGAQDWPAWQAALRHDATARYASRSAQPVASAAAADAAGATERAHAADAQQAWLAYAPRWLLGLVFAASMLLLWWRERR